MKKEFFNKKNIIIMVSIIVIIAIMVTLIIVNPFKKKKKVENTNEIKDITKIESKDDLLEVINTVGNMYYQDYYYTLVTKEDLEKHAEFGINISLKSIELAMGFSDDLTENLEKYECNTDTTKVHIYPKAPYEKTDYEINIDVVCKK